MKSPREILLHRHRAAEPKLDALRAKAVAELTPAASSRESRRLSASWPSRVAWVLWRELIFPCRHIWAGLAAVWVAIFAFNHFALAEPRTISADSSAGTPEIRMVLQEQRRMLAELIDSSDQPPAEAPKPFAPRPRGELRTFVTLV
jgi:hypothetical protein